MTPALETADSRRLLYFEVARDISRANSTDSLKKACRGATEAFGYDYYLFGGYYPSVESLVISSTFPDEWRMKYDSNGYVAIDPTVKHSWTSTNPIVWRKVEYSEGKIGELERMVMNEAYEFGLRSGISVPVHGSGAEGCMLSLASKEEHGILDVSENTVIFHLRNAIKKLEVTNRSHAVAKAVAHSKITPF